MTIQTASYYPQSELGVPYTWLPGVVPGPEAKFQATSMWTVLPNNTQAVRDLSKGKSTLVKWKGPGLQMPLSPFTSLYTHLLNTPSALCWPLLRFPEEEKLLIQSEVSLSVHFTHLTYKLPSSKGNWGSLLGPNPSHSVSHPDKYRKNCPLHGFGNLTGWVRKRFIPMSQLDK